MDNHLFLVTDQPGGYYFLDGGVRVYDFRVYNAKGEGVGVVRQLTADAVELLLELHDGSSVVTAANPGTGYAGAWPYDLLDVIDFEHFEDWDRLAADTQAWQESARWT